ncbi:MAG: alpha/beta fold hydrolase, partial [Pseudomonadota bacterium]
MPVSVLADTPTHWTEHGTGPTSVLVHCSLGSVGAWLPLTRALPGRRLLAFDLPGHGQSGAVDAARGAHTQTRDVLSEFCALNASGPVDLVGHSFGATVALRFAIEAPERVRSLVLLEPVLFALARQTAPDVFAGYQRASATENAAFDRNDNAAAARAFYAHWGGPRPWDELEVETRRYMTSRIELI